MGFSLYMPQSSFYSWFRRSVPRCHVAFRSPPESPCPSNPYCLEPQTQPLDEVPSPNCLTRGAFTLQVLLIGCHVQTVFVINESCLNHSLLFLSTPPSIFLYFFFLTSKSISSSKLIKQNEFVYAIFLPVTFFPSRLIVNGIIGNDYEER